MTAGIDLESLWKTFSGLQPTERVSMVRQVADQLEWLLRAATEQGLSISEVNQAHITGAILALRAVSGADPFLSM